MELHQTPVWVISLLCLSLITVQLLGQEFTDFVRINHQDSNLGTDLGVGLWAWPMPMDFDEDGDLDLVVSCPDVPFNGTYFFERIDGTDGDQTLFKPPVYLGVGRKNLQVSYTNDTAKVFSPGVEYLDFRKQLFSRPRTLTDHKSLQNLHEKIRFSQWKYVDYDDDGDLDLIAGIDEWGDYGWDNAFNAQGKWTNGPLHGYVYLLENENGQYYNKGKILAGGKPIDVYGAPSPSMNDFDGDGDLDLICGEFLDRFTWFENIGSRKMPKYVEGRFLRNANGIIKMDLQMITPAAVDWDLDGDMDLIVGDEDGRVALLENTGDVRQSMPQFESPKYLRQKAGNVKFGALATPFSVDWDDDGDEDLICGNTAGYLGFIENLDGGNPPSFGKPQLLEADGKIIRIMAGDSGSIQGPAEKKWGYTTLSVADWDGDGLHDIVVNSIWGIVVWFKNVGIPGNPKLTAATPVQVDWGEDQPPKPEWNWWDPKPNMLSTQWRTTPVAIDWNRDGLMDLVTLDHEGYLAWYERFQEEGQLKLQPGRRIFHGVGAQIFDRKNEILGKGDGPLCLNGEKYGRSGRRKWCFSDWDQDGDQDILINSQNIAWFEQVRKEGEKIYFSFRGNLSNDKLAGHSTSPTVVDWDGNGTPDLLVGAEDGHFYYLKNE